MSATLLGRAGPAARAAATYGAAIVLATAVGAAAVASLGADVGLALRTVLASSLGSWIGFGQTLNKVTPLLLGGLAVALGLRGGFFNIGVDGQIYLGAIAATGMAFALPSSGLPAPVAMGLVLVAGLGGGALLGGVPAILRAYWGVSEIFVTVMLNFVMLFLTEYLTTGPWNDPMAGEAISRLIPEGTSLPMLLPASGTHAGILVAVGCVPLLWWLFNRTALGFEIRAVGDNSLAARVAGVSVPRITLIVLSASGALAGMAGAIEVAGFHNRLILGLSPGYGVMAILIAVLGRAAPGGVLLASVAMAVLLVGSDSLQRSIGLPASAALVFQAVMMLAVLTLESGRRRTV
jgi:general nucleoside transport system permease protein